jgi:23S rRNA (guanosine2251-2'-O)-methyltransferase
MKPPHGNRPGGSPRPPSDRSPYREPGGGGATRKFGPGGSGPRFDARPSHGGGHHSSQQGETGSREQHKTRPQGGFQSRPDRGVPSGESAAPHGRSDKVHRQDNPKPKGFKPRHPGQTNRPREHDAPRRIPDAPKAPDSPKGTVWLYGHHAVAAALANPSRRLRRLLLTEDAEATIVKNLSPPWAVPPERVDRARLDHLLGRDLVHQGAALLADPLAPPSLQSVLEKPGVIVVLDQVTDPRNVGAILRSAAAFGAAAVITQDRNAPEETGGLAKAASGALEKMPLLRAVNIARTLIALKAANIWCIGLDAAGPALSGPAFADRRVALVLGAEGEGLRRLTRETCDEIAGLAIKGAVESLNVSAAASVALYELARR